MNADILSLVALLFVLAMLVGVVLLIAHRSKPKLNKKYFTNRWKQIEDMQNLPMAVLKADSLVDEALRRIHVKGGTMGERLNNSSGFLQDINATWSAHKLRNKIAHENGNEPSTTECKKALRHFKRALKDLGAL
jgi:hypothetical protein